MGQNNVAVQIQNLSKFIKKKELLLPFNYELSKGQILALCGGNGAGKSTLIRLITGLIQPTTGDVTINGVNRKKDKRQFLEQFGYMPDDFQFQKTITTKETIDFYAKIKKIDDAKSKEILKEVGLFNQLDEKVGNFSKGMKQRLLLAQALLADPSVLILDEPTNGLDPYWVNQFCEMMLHAKEKEQTVIFSTHDLHVAEKIADHVVFLQDGEAISQGPVHEFLDIGLYETFQRLYLKTV